MTTPNKREPIPRYVRINSRVTTTRQWKAKKRKDLSKLVKAFAVYRLGSAYCPGYPQNIDKLDEVLTAMTASHSRKNWG